jgi:protein tyrosine phosphatase
MVWECSVPVIVMLTKLFENGRTKAHIYWPACHNTTIQFAEISVTKIDEEDYGCVVIRSFILTKGSEFRKVHHIHYTAWPDFGVPSTSDGIRELVNFVNMCKDDNNNISSPSSSSSSVQGPMVIHCSAGVGRSGAFIAIHYACSLIDSESYFSIFQIVSQMRSERIGMVQNEKQYEFIHNSVSDYKAVSSPSCSDLSFSYSDESSSEGEMELSSTSSSSNFRSNNWRKISSDHVSNISLTSSAVYMRAS